MPHSAFTSNRAHHHRRVIRLNICVYKYIYIYKSLRPAQHITELCVKCLFLLMLLSTMWRGIIVRSCLRIRCFQEIPLTSLSGEGGGGAGGWGSDEWFISLSRRCSHKSSDLLILRIPIVYVRLWGFVYLDTCVMLTVSIAWAGSRY